MPRYKLLILDLDGTLRDSLTVIYGDIDRTLTKFGLPPVDTVTRDTSHTLLVPQLFELLVPHDRELVERMSDHYREIVRVRPSEATPLFDGVRDTLLHCHKIDIRLAIATAGRTAFATSWLQASQIDHLFAAIMGGDSTARSKPHPDMLLAIMDNSGVNARDVMFVGDTATDIEMGLAAEVTTVGAAYGYHDAERLKAAGAHYVINSFSELLPLLQ